MTLESQPRAGAFPADQPHTGDRASHQQQQRPGEAQPRDDRDQRDQLDHHVQPEQSHHDLLTLSNARTRVVSPIGGAYLATPLSKRRYFTRDKAAVLWEPASMSATQLTRDGLTFDVTEDGPPDGEPVVRPPLPLRP